MRSLRRKSAEIGASVQQKTFILRAALAVGSGVDAQFVAIQ